MQENTLRLLDLKSKRNSDIEQIARGLQLTGRKKSSEVEDKIDRISGTYDSDLHRSNERVETKRKKRHERMIEI